MTLAQAGAGDEHHIGVLLDEIEMEQILDQRAVDLGGPVPVELIERLEHREAGLRDAALDAAIVAGRRFPVDQFGQVVQVRPLFLGRGLCQ